MKALLSLMGIGLLLIVGGAGCNRATDLDKEKKQAGPATASKPNVAFVTNGIASFWVIAEKGAQMILQSGH